MVVKKKKFALPMTIVIKNCKRGSFAWHHEKRHEYQEKRWGLLSKFCIVDEWLRLFAVFAVITFNFIFIALFVFTLFMLNFILEYDADMYALKKTKNWKAWLRIEAVNK